MAEDENLGASKSLNMGDSASPGISKSVNMGDSASPGISKSADLEEDTMSAVGKSTNVEEDESPGIRNCIKMEANEASQYHWPSHFSWSNERGMSLSEKQDFLRWFDKEFFRRRDKDDFWSNIPDIKRRIELIELNQTPKSYLSEAEDKGWFPTRSEALAERDLTPELTSSIIKSYVALTDSMDALPVIDHLLQQDALSRRNYNQIRRVTDSEARNRDLLERVLKGSELLYAEFVSALYNTDQMVLGKKILNELEFQISGKTKISFTSSMIAYIKNCFSDFTKTLSNRYSGSMYEEICGVLGTLKQIILNG